MRWIISLFLALHWTGQASGQTNDYSQELMQDDFAEFEELMEILDDRQTVLCRVR
jgi:hypothetical protein